LDGLGTAWLGDTHRLWPWITDKGLLKLIRQRRRADKPPLFDLYYFPDNTMLPVGIDAV